MLLSLHDPDINECSANNGDCEHNCTNTVSSYYCSCAIGFNLNADEHNCDGMCRSIAI